MVDSTGSTNADLAAAARAGAEEATVRVAEHQRDGRGRMGRGWNAPPRSALTMSLLVRPRVAVAKWSWLPLLAGVAVADAVRSVGEVEATLKWPNDVMVSGLKLAGVMLERVDTPAGPAAVLGVGINVTNSRAELPVPAATSLLLEGAASTDRQPLLVSVLRAIEARYAAWVLDAEAGSAPITGGLQASYIRRCATLGREIRVELPDESMVSGRAETVDEDGRLVVVSPAGREVLAAGDVVHVRPERSAAP